jgi:glycosyltransferase A (GT-A) superfamily protein (DUF2064 family)
MPSAAAPTRALVVFARAPEAGQVKTRLARELGEAAALAAYRELGALVLGAVAGLPDCETVVSYTPANREPLMRAWLGPGPRTDCPEVSTGLIETAFGRLDRADAVFGPAADGGYYLVGMKRPIGELFEAIPWSTDATLSTTLARATAAALEVALLDERRDIDTAEDWRRWQSARRNAEPLD